jgi:hypothetical protein
MNTPNFVPARSLSTRLLLTSFLSICLLSACTNNPVRKVALSTHAIPSVDECQAWLNSLDHQIKKHDAQYQRVDGLPWLRTDRFWASLKTDDQQAKNAIYDEHIKKGSEAFLDELFLLGKVDEDDVQQCIQVLAEQGRKQRSYAEVSQTTDHYSSLKRVLGLYAITKMFALNGIVGYQTESIQQIDAFNKKLKTGLKSKDYRHYQFAHVGNKASKAADYKALFDQAYAATPLAVPQLESEHLSDLFRLHAPQIVVENDHEDDAIGSIELSHTGDVVVNNETPIIYTYPTYTRFKGNNLLQLNYAFWFPSRPSNDVYGGFLDGILWRVTLDTDANVLLFDSIHQCGCYHKYFIPQSNQQALSALPWDEKTEPVMILGVNDAVSPTLYINSIEHYILAVNKKANPEFSPVSLNYEMTDYGKLNRLQYKDEFVTYRKSLFASDGLVKGSERIERLYFWPLGIKSAGAMRQKGTHAIAFVGRRHFDDPFILDEVFK